MSRQWSNPVPGPHPRPDLLDAAIYRRVAQLPNGSTGRVQRVNRSGSRVKLFMQTGYYLVVPSDEVFVLRPEEPLP